MSAEHRCHPLRADTQKSLRARQQFMQQMHENDMVLKVGRQQISAQRSRFASRPGREAYLAAAAAQELELLEDDAVVYKAIGPALVKQDPMEAKSNVRKRLEFIKNEADRLDGQLKGLEEKQAKVQQQILALQQQHTQKGGGAQKVAA
jgi:prefoldin beta subunit